MSTIAELETAIRYDLKDSGTVQKFSSAQIYAYVNRFRIYLAGLAYRNRLLPLVKLGTSTMTAGSETYTLPSDFYAEHLICFDDKSEPLTKIETLDQYIREGHGTSTATGQPNKYMILGSSLLIFDPLSDGTSTILENYYYYVPAAYSTATTTATMPLGGILDEFWRQYVVNMLLNIDEYNINLESQLLDGLSMEILGALVGRSQRFPIIPTDGGAWADDGYIDNKYVSYP